ncbi:MAG: YdiU family protein [Gemmatimonadaceae bacterium]|nr:YdiU family protein [Gemmatimonadaceae bacterium]
MPLTFDNQFTTRLPGDPNPANTRRQVLGAAWSPVEPTPVAAPRVLAVSPDVMALVGFEPGAQDAPEFANVFGGNALLPGMRPYAANYGGHQFGNWAGQLGDGRAISLGEVVNAHGQRWELQLKGAGPTPYSRTADGRAVLRSSIREFLCSEAMHYLGVPTTRALSLVATGEAVVRDMFYNGNAREEPGAIVCRVSPSFIRFGNFEIFAARGELELLAQLVDFTIARDYPHLTGTTDEKRIAWFAEVAERTAIMVVHWMRVGFVHGVMNTDNMSILGLTIDYGPYGWVDNFDPTWTPNTTDAHGRRYRFGQQPTIAQWNLVRLAEAIAPVMPPGEHLQAGIDRFAATFVREYDAMNAAKFGLPITDDAKTLMREAFKLLYDAEVDYTLFFRALGEIPDELPATPAVTLLGDVFYDDARRDAEAANVQAWLERWHAMVRETGVPFAERRARMHAVNPWFVLRNYVAQQAIDAAEAGDPSLVRTLLDVLRTPYDEQPAHAAFAQRRPEWAKTKAGCSMLSCSS